MRRWRTWKLAWILAAGAARAGDARPPVWPLDQPPVLTSSFGEYRATHVHAGIDLGTGGQSGKRCFAVGDGCVSRLRMSPFGYGKALYIQLDSGPLVVYAHLSRFAAPMAERARSEQRRLGAYTFDLALTPGQMRVQRGQVVAWSGQTGVGVPHLHFEVRDGDVARNPQGAGFAVPDTLPPVIEDVEVLPLDAASQVDGDLAPRVVRVAGSAGLQRPLPVAGRLGFAVRAWDAAVAGPWRQAPYRYELRIDGRRLFRAVLERLDYAHSDQVVLEYDAERLVERDEGSFLLFTVPGTRLEGRESFEGTDGVLRARAPAWNWRLRPDFEIGPGRHEAEIEVADEAGHVTKARLPLWVSRGPRLRALRAETDGGTSRLLCAAEDRDAESLQVSVAASTDLGSTWQPVALRQTPGSGVWLGETPASLSDPLVLRAEAREPSGLVDVRTWASGALQPAPAALPVEVRSRWRSGRLEVEIELATLAAAPPEVEVVLADSSRAPLAVRQVETRRYRAAFDLESLPDRLCGLEVRATAVDGRRAGVRRALRARLVRRGRAAHVDDLDPNLVLDIPAAALLQDVALRVRPVAARELALGPELRPAGPCLWVEPRSALLDAPVRVVLRPNAAEAAPLSSKPGGVVPVPGGHLGIFWVNREGKLRWLSSDLQAGGALVATTRYLSLFAVLADSTPPRLGALRLEGRGRAAQLRFQVEDRGADLGDGGIRVELDGAAAIPEWDPETGEVQVQPELPLARGTHRLRVRAVDQVGNAAERVSTFRIQ